MLEIELSFDQGIQVRESIYVFDKILG